MSGVDQGATNSDIFNERKRLLNQFCNTLETQGIRYVILSGYQGYPDQIDSDIDFMVTEDDFLKVRNLFKDSVTHFGAPLIQVLQHETTASYFILANQIGGHIAYLHPDAAASYRRKGRLWLKSETVLDSRRQTEDGFWVPAQAVEFEYYFVKRVDKRLVEESHVRRFNSLLSADPEGCRDVIASLMPTNKVVEILDAIKTHNTEWFAEHRDDLQTMLSASQTNESIFERVKSFCSDSVRKLARILKPTGLVIGVLGPDGSGKTTVIEHIEKELLPAFRKLKRFHLRPHFGKQGSGNAVTEPHSEPPRSALAGLAKMVLFIIDYWWGYIRRIYPAKICSTLIIFDRHFYDMLVDPERYRLPKNFWPARYLAKLIPQPDIWLVLDSPPELLVSRKGELDLAEAEKFSARYREIAEVLTDAHIVYTGGTLEETYSNAIRPLLSVLANRQTNRSKP